MALFDVQNANTHARKTPVLALLIALGFVAAGPVHGKSDNIVRVQADPGGAQARPLPDQEGGSRTQPGPGNGQGLDDGGSESHPDSGQMPIPDGPGCPYRNQELELIV